MSSTTFPPRCSSLDCIQVRQDPQRHPQTDCIDVFPVVLTYIDVSSTAIGLSPTLSFYTVSIANCASGFGRFTAGRLSDRIGRNGFHETMMCFLTLYYAGALNIIIPTTLVAGIMTYAWPYARTAASVVVVAIIYGYVLRLPYFTFLVNAMFAASRLAHMSLFSPSQ